MGCKPKLIPKGIIKAKVEVMFLIILFLNSIFLRFIKSKIPQQIEIK